MSAAPAARAAELRAQLAQHDYRYYVLDDPLSYMFDPNKKGKGPPVVAYAVPAPK